MIEKCAFRKPRLKVPLYPTLTARICWGKLKTAERQVNCPYCTTAAGAHAVNSGQRFFHSRSRVCCAVLPPGGDWDLGIAGGKQIFFLEN